MAKRTHSPLTLCRTERYVHPECSIITQNASKMRKSCCGIDCTERFNKNSELSLLPLSLRGAPSDGKARSMHTVYRRACMHRIVICPAIMQTSNHFHMFVLHFHKFGGLTKGRLSKESLLLRLFESFLQSHIVLTG